ncbi:MAG: hypothetical protein IPF46_06945 [Saprospiraceae bacterium]|nr:hypothetical protein [Candidatus Vicinibacter affinis]MBK6823427.1 hypothetical protein [Candidatus Vicinibacter affinis]MBK7693419.1 hypothetical protein [Candidatus Vicinibacter affinis]MBK7798253.1 hypothetical protein [Candidatus Vicinibacter affinis]MBP7307168.1 hypothetical protein [Saprospiraceae bacterium]
MQSKGILSGILLMVCCVIGCNQSNLIKEPLDNSFVILLTNDNKEFITIYSDLNKITPKDFTKLNVGKKERLDFINIKRKVTAEEFVKLEKMGNIHMVINDQNLDLQKIVDGNTLKDNLLSFSNIPDNQKGLVIKYLHNKGYYVIFKEYRGDYVMIPIKR